MVMMMVVVPMDVDRVYAAAFVLADAAAKPVYSVNADVIIFVFAAAVVRI